MDVSSVPLCDFRRKRPDPNHDRAELVCLAAGGEHLAWVGGDQAGLVNACARCPIPGVMDSDPAVCLFLRPLRLIAEDQAFFPCRVSRGIFRRRFPLDMETCHSCQFWFPRPPLQRIHGHEEDTSHLLGKLTRYLKRQDEFDDVLKGNTASMRKAMAYFKMFLEQF